MISRNELRKIARAKLKDSEVRYRLIGTARRINAFNMIESAKVLLKVLSITLPLQGIGLAIPASQAG